MQDTIYQTQGLTFTLPAVEHNDWHEDQSKSTESYWITKFGIDAHLTFKHNVMNNTKFWHVEFDELSHLDTRFQPDEFELAKEYIANHMHWIALQKLQEILVWTKITVGSPDSDPVTDLYNQMVDSLIKDR